MRVRQCCSERDLGNAMKSRRGDRSTRVRLVDWLLRSKIRRGERRWSEPFVEDVNCASLQSQPSQKVRPATPIALKPKYEGLVTSCVAQSLSVRRMKELISQPKPGAQLGWGLCDRARPSVTGQSSFNFSEGRILPQ